ncbi:unnamed protein product [Closterium sp. Naga37s-1]|nr:unnamed protein product [Closterium sp. Naga37s-1]
MNVNRPTSYASTHPPPSSDIQSAIDCSSLGWFSSSSPPPLSLPAIASTLPLHARPPLIPCSFTGERESESCCQRSQALPGSSRVAAIGPTGQHRTTIMNSSQAMSPAVETRASASSVDSPATHLSPNPVLSDSYRRPRHFLKRSVCSLIPSSPSPSSAKRACKRRLFLELDEAPRRDGTECSASFAGDDAEVATPLFREEYSRHRTLLRPLPSPLHLGLSCADVTAHDASTKLYDGERDGASSPCSSVADGECGQVPTPGRVEGPLSSFWEADVTTPPTSPRPDALPVCPGAPMKPRPLAITCHVPSAALHRIMRPLFL